ncbi:hypothetical protein BMS3Abin05_01662 [bacterium BMS3Abin05]|nr:hypothetical protein BMS3Abin05_01662 [bacterium BMS3Abin05]GBE27118.1 hypothetical protein BMS3Bbin03_01038 [bacterium BMS3Bbin03]
MPKSSKIYDFKDVRRANEIENLLDNLEIFVREGDYVGLDETIASLTTQSAWSIPRLVFRLQKYLILWDKQLINAYRDVLVQIGISAVPELKASFKKKHVRHIFYEIASEIYVSEMIDNYFAWRDHELSENAYTVRQYRLVDEIVQLGSPVVPQVIRNLMNVNIREYLIVALGKIGNKRATMVLAAFLRETQPVGFERVRPLVQKLVRALGSIGDRRAVRPLLDFLGSDFMVGKADAAEAIEKILGKNFGKYQSFGNNKRSWRSYQLRVLDYLQNRNSAAPQMKLVKGNFS